MRGRCSDPSKEVLRRERIRAARTGTKHSEETKAKITQSAMYSQPLRREREMWDERLAWASGTQSRSN